MGRVEGKVLGQYDFDGETHPGGPVASDPRDMFKLVDAYRDSFVDPEFWWFTRGDARVCVAEEGNTIKVVVVGYTPRGYVANPLLCFVNEGDSVFSAWQIPRKVAWQDYFEDTDPWQLPGIGDKNALAAEFLADFDRLATYFDPQDAANHAGITRLSEGRKLQLLQRWGVL